MSCSGVESYEHGGVQWHIRPVINKLRPKEQFPERRFDPNTLDCQRFSKTRPNCPESSPPSMSMVNFLSLFICLARDETRDTLALPFGPGFDAKNDNVD